MAITPTPTIPTLPTPPTTSNPASFDAAADAFLGGLPAWATAVQSVGNATQANANEATTQATTATAQAVIATQQAAQAGLAVAAAQAVSGATAWVSGQYYAQYAVVISPGNGQNYRRRAAGSGTTDPKDDPGNWFPLLLSQTLPFQSMGVDTPASAGICYIFTASCKLTLPASPAVGDLVGFENGSGTVTCTIDPNGKKIRGDASVMVLDSKTAAETLKFSGDSYGWVKA